MNRTAFLLGLALTSSMALAQQRPAADAAAPAAEQAGPVNVVVQGVAPQQWEYDVLQITIPVEDRGANQLRDTLNQRGRQGWELTSGLNFDGRATYVFRRPIIPGVRR